MSNQDKLDQYTKKILVALEETILNPESEYFIDPDDHPKAESGHADIAPMIHALATVAPTLLYRQLTSTEIDVLEFNHVANRLCMRFANIITEQP